jgi:hypothetical protein
MIWSSTHTRIAAVAGVGILALLAATAYVHQQIVQAKNQATQDAQAQFQRQLVDQQKAMQADFDAKLKARDAEYQQNAATLQKQFQGSMTQVLALINQRANLPVPLQVVTPAPTKENPNPLPTVPVPQADFPAAKEYVQACETCKLDLAKTQADLADVQQQRAAEAKLAQQQIDSLKTQRDAALTAAKGGNWIHRLGKQVKVIACAGAGAAAGGSQGAKGAAIGAVGGAVVCSLF